MRASILVATPHPAFGDLLRISLQESRKYQVKLVRSGKEVRDAIQESRYTLAILDSSLPDEPFVPLCLYLIEQQEDIQLIVIPPDNNPNHPALAGLMPHGYLHRPFYLPDLLETVAKLLEQREETQPLPVAPQVDLPHWLQDPVILRAYLESEIRTTQAQAAIVGVSAVEQNAETLRAYAGQMDEAAAREFAAVVFRYWNRGDKTDLMRFVRLTANKRDYLVYATQISGDLVLILAYENSVPMSQIRPQTKALATSLALLPPKDESAGAKRKPSESEEALLPELIEEEIDDTLFFGRMQNSFPRAGQQPAGEAQLAENDLEGVEFINLSTLLGVVPSPDPEVPAVEPRFPNNGWMMGIDPSLPPNGYGDRENGRSQSDSSDDQQHWNNQEGLSSVIDLPASPAAAYETPSAVTQQPDEESILAEMRRMEEALAKAADAEAAGAEAVDAEAVDAEAAPPVQAEDALNRGYNEAPTQPLPQQAEPSDAVKAGEGAGTKDPTAAPPPTDATQQSARPRVDVDAASAKTIGVTVPGKTKPLTPRPETELTPDEEEGAIEQTRSSLLTNYTNLNQLEPVSPGVSVLNYTCVLVPRLPQHYLTGSLADLLAGWVQQLCLAFGWRLEGLSIRPEYLQWTVQVAPSVSPGNLVKIMRQRTSMHIFNSFAHIREQNPSGDFWAVGYLIVSGSQPPSPQLLRDYILQTRKRQGISR